MKTRLLFTLLLIFAATLPRAAADEWISEQYRCALTIPTQESWTASIRQSLPFGEVIFHAASMVSSQGFMITFAPEMPSGDLKNPALVKRITELLESQGWIAGAPTQLVWKNRKFLQFVAQRRDSISGKLIGIVRAAVREKNLYVITAYGKGGADRAEDPDFMRVMETFRFVEKPTVIVDNPPLSAEMYRIAAIGTAGAAAALFAAFGAGVLRARAGTEE